MAAAASASGAAAHASLEAWARNTGKKQATWPEQGQGNMDEFHVSWFPGLLSLVSCWRISNMFHGSHFSGIFQREE
jgi:hypothetical protein